MAKYTGDSSAIPHTAIEAYWKLRTGAGTDDDRKVLRDLARTYKSYLIPAMQALVETSVEKLADDTLCVIYEALTARGV